jgi:outer membrane lipoprotein-sorting protein
MKFFAFSTLAGAGLILFAALSPQTLIDKQAALLKDAKGLKVAYTFRHVGGSSAEYTLTYSKPNMVLVDGPDRIVESDGKTLWEYNKTAKTYMESPLTPELLAKRAQADEVIAWASFFTEDFVKHMTNLQAGASRVIKGNAVTEVNVTLAGTPPRALTIFMDDKLGIARGFTMKSADGDTLATAATIEISAEPYAAEKFAFKAPEGATKAVAPSTDVNGTGFASVQAIFQNNCGGCHGGARGKGGFSVSSYQAIMRGSGSGPVVTAGDPDNSTLVKLITGEAAPKMPPSGQVPADDVAKIKAWIKDGAKQ